MMLASKTRPDQDADSGFTLIELLVVMIIIGILAATAIPVFLSQRAKARDTQVKADVSRLGKEVATYYVDGTTALSVDYATTPGSAILKDGATVVTTVPLTNGTTGTTSTGLGLSTGWCVSLTNSNGNVKTYQYSAVGGLKAGVCT